MNDTQCCPLAFICTYVLPNTHKYLHTCAHAKAQAPLKAAVMDKVRVYKALAL